MNSSSPVVISAAAPTVRQLLETTDLQEIIQEYNKCCPLRAGKLTTEWLNKFKNLQYCEEQKKQEQECKKLEIFVRGEEKVYDSDSDKPRIYLNINARDELDDNYGIDYTPWTRLLTYPVCITDVERYGVARLLATIIDGITFHGWEEEETQTFFGNIVKCGEELKLMMEQSVKMENADGSITFVPQTEFL